MYNMCIKANKWNFQHTHTHTNTLTGPAITVLLANVSSVLQQDPGTIQVAQSDSQVERSPSTRV